METTVLEVNAESPDPESIRRAAEALRGGRLVAFPTETVYGLGANALDASAVARIFEAKGRPARNPIIVHVAGAHAARTLVTAWPPETEILAAKFWPGPLTLVLPKSALVPDVVTGGGPTVGIRVPANPVALSLLRDADIPVAAPSANRSTEVSPTTAAHVLKGLRGRIDIVLDGGPASGGIESTVLDLSCERPRLLRLGLVSAAQIEATIGPVDRDLVPDETLEPLPSPGLMRRHYAPRAAVQLVDSERAETALQSLLSGHRLIGWMPLHMPTHAESARLIVRHMPDMPDAYSSRLYSALHALDDAGVERIVIEMPPDAPEWHAVRDRLARSAMSD